MRIVGGFLSGRRFSGPSGRGATRPTSERVREGLASALASRGLIEGARVLDLYAGTGALAFEALSRGAREATLVERSRVAARAIERSARELGLEGRARVVVADLEGERWLRALRGSIFDLVLVDPPYARVERVGLLLSSLASEAKLAPGAAIVVEHARGAPPTLPAGFVESSSYRYGDTQVLLARAQIDEDQG